MGNDSPSNVNTSLQLVLEPSPNFLLWSPVSNIKSCSPLLHWTRMLYRISLSCLSENVCRSQIRNERVGSFGFRRWNRKKETIILYSCSPRHVSKNYNLCMSGRDGSLQLCITWCLALASYRTVRIIASV